MVEPLGDPMHDRLLQSLVMQYRRINEGGELRLPAHDILGLDAHALPDRIERRKLRATLQIGLMLYHRLRPQIILLSRQLKFQPTLARPPPGCPLALTPR